MVRSFSRCFWLSIFAAALIIWLVAGPTMLTNIGATPADRIARDYERRLEREDPKAAEELREFRRRTNSSPVVAALYRFESPQFDDLSGLRALAEHCGDPNSMLDYELIRIANDKELLRTEQERIDFLYAHGTTVQLLRESDGQQAAQEYVQNLVSASKSGPDAWHAVRDNSINAVVLSLIEEPKLRSYFIENGDWLGEILLQLREPEPEPDESEPHEPNDKVDILDPEESFREIIKTALKYHPLTREAVKDLDLGPDAFQMFFLLGDVIGAAVNDHHLPLQEVLEVTFANAGYLRDAYETLGGSEAAAEEIANRLADLRLKHRAAWNAAKRYPLALRLIDEVPDDAPKVLEQLGSDDIAAFLFANYEDAIEPACKALARWNDVSFFVLNKYAGNERVKDYLKNEEVGFRLVPFLMVEGDGGLDKLDSSVAWINKNLDQNGDSIGSEWWEAVPIVGAPGKVIQNWRNGVPCEWSELGWAAVDVADGVLLVASFGGSSAITVGKQTMKQAGKSIINVAAKKAARTQSVKASARAGAKLLAEGSLLSRSRALLAKVARTQSGQKVVWLGRVVSQAGAMTVRSAKSIASGTNRVWQAVPAGIRKAVYRACLAAGLATTLASRSVPIVLEKLTTLASEWLQKFPQLAAEAMQRAIESVRDGIGELAPFYWTVYFVVSIALAAIFVWAIRPTSTGGRKVRYA